MMTGGIYSVPYDVSRTELLLDSEKALKNDSHIHNGKGGVL